MHFANAMHGSFVNEFKRSRKNGKLRGCPEKKSRSLKGFKRGERKYLYFQTFAISESQQMLFETLFKN